MGLSSNHMGAILQEVLKIPIPNKSAVKHRSTLGGLDQYTVANIKYTGDECPPPPSKNGHTVKQSDCHCETVYDQLTPYKTEYGEWLDN